MKRSGLMLAFAVSVAHADPPKIPVPSQPPQESATEPSAAQAAPEESPVSTTTRDPNDKSWRLYDNRIVKAHMRVNAAWTLMEVKETADSGSVSFTMSRLPLVTISIMRQPMDAPFETYMSSASLTPEYPAGYKKTRAVFAGQPALLTRGKAKDERFDESFFVSDGKSIYQVSFSAPQEFWKDANTQYFDPLKRSFRWLR